MKEKVEKVKGKGISAITALGLTFVILAVGALGYLLYDKYVKEGEEKEVVVAKVKTVTANDTLRVNEYLGKIYNTFALSIPEFTNINSADENWVWYVAFLNCPAVSDGNFDEGDGILYNDITLSAKELFGTNFTKILEKKDTGFYAIYDSSTDSFNLGGGGGPQFTPDFVISDIKKTITGFDVNILEYKIDGWDTEGKYKDYLYGKSPNSSLDGKEIKQFDKNQEKLIEDYVLANPSKFNVKQIVLTEDATTKDLYIVSSKNI